MDKEELARRRAMRKQQMSNRLTERDLKVLAVDCSDIIDECRRRYEAKEKATNAVQRLKAGLHDLMKDDPSST